MQQRIGSGRCGGLPGPSIESRAFRGRAGGFLRGRTHLERRRSRTAFRFGCLSSGIRDGGRSSLLGARNRPGEPAQFASTSYANSPCQGGLVTRALHTQTQTLGAVWTSSIALDTAISAGKAVVGRTIASSFSTSFSRCRCSESIGWIHLSSLERPWTRRGRHF